MPFLYILSMETVIIEIINPKARKLLKTLADLDLITFHKSTESKYSEVLKSTRSQSEISPCSEEIADEVEAVRLRRA